MPTLQTDEHIRHSVVHGLQGRGIDARSARDAGIAGSSDRELMAFCNDRDRVLLTNDDDLLSLADAGDHPGLIFQTTQFARPGKLVQATVRLVRTVPERAFPGAIFFVP